MPSIFFGQTHSRNQRSLVFAAQSRSGRRGQRRGEFDGSIPLDSFYMKSWAPPLCEQLKKGHPESPLWDFDYSLFSSMFYRACKTLGLTMTRRHSGPSIDRALNKRSLLEVQKRGRWKSFKSVSRYEKSARLAANFGMLPLALQRHCLEAESQLGDVMLGRRRALPPPTVGVA